MAKKVKAGKVKRGLVPLIVSCVIIAILIVALSIGNAIAFKYATVIDSVLSQPIVDEEEREAATASGQELAQILDRDNMELEVPFHRIPVPIYEIVFEIRREKNPCSLCAKLRRGALHSELNRLGLRKIALGHHWDDAVETMLMNLLFEGRIGCFQPVTYLDRSGITQIRPLLYVQEREVRGTVKRLGLPVCPNPCPANGSSRREEVKALIRSLQADYPDLKQKIFGAMQRYPLAGWAPGGAAGAEKDGQGT